MVTVYLGIVQAPLPPQGCRQSWFYPNAICKEFAEGKLPTPCFSFPLRSRAQGGFLLALEVSVLVTAVIRAGALVLLLNCSSCWRSGKCYFVPRNLRAA